MHRYYLLERWVRISVRTQASSHEGRTSVYDVQEKTESCKDGRWGVKLPQFDPIWVSVTEIRIGWGKWKKSVRRMLLPGLLLVSF